MNLDGTTSQTLKLDVKRRTETLFEAQRQRVFKRTDRLFALILLLEWVGAIIATLCISPRAWAGTVSQVHIHVWTAIWLGGTIALLPAYLACIQPGKVLTRQTIAFAQMVMSALLIHISGGRIETHFHVFGSLAFLAFYRDWKVLVTASCVVAIDHLLRGIYWPQSVYGVINPEPWRWLEHSFWVLFADVFLVISIKQSLKEMYSLAHRQAELELTNQVIEEKVKIRTTDLEKEIERRKKAESSLQKQTYELSHVNQQLQASTYDLIQARDKAVQASAFKSKFLANVSHEILTPLNGVISMSHLLKHTQLTSEQIEITQIVQSSADSLQDLIKDILDFSKIEAGKIDIQSYAVDIRNLLEECTHIFQEEAHQKQLLLATYIDQEVPPSINTDGKRLRQVLLNLLSNAVKFTEVGSVTVNVSIVNTNPDHAQIKFAVMDTGIGISEQSLQNLFQPFCHIYTSKEVKYAGSGLGLSIAKSLVELLGGELSFQTTQHKGTVFSFGVPLVLPEPRLMDLNADKGESVHFTLQPANEIPILVVEDNAVNQKVASLLLRKLGYSPNVVENGRLAIEAATHHKWAIILMDCQMPEMNGFEATAEIRKIESHTKSHTPIIAITAQAYADDKDKCLAAGMDDYISKPVTMEKLNAVLQHWLTKPTPDNMDKDEPHTKSQMLTV